MATRTRVELVDDIDGSHAEETLEFGLDGVQFEIDLTGSNATRLREELEPYILKARRTSGRKKIVKKPASKAAAATPPAPASAPAAAPAEMRTTVLPTAGRPLDAGDRIALKKFAAANGLKIPGDKGRLSASLVEKWTNAGRPT